MISIKNILKLAAILISLTIAGCASLPPPYSYPGDDAAVIYMSLTNGEKMSTYSNWGLQITPEDPALRSRLSSIGVSTSSRIYDWSPASKQFEIVESDEYGNTTLLFKLPPGKYKITSINTRSSLNTDGTSLASSMFITKIVDPKWANQLSSMAKPAGLKDAQKTEPIVIEAVPGMNYIGSFRAISSACSNLAREKPCRPFSVEIRDKFYRDTKIVKSKLKSETMQTPPYLNRTLKIERSTNPTVYSAE